MSIGISLLLGDSLETTQAQATGFELTPLNGRVCREFGIPFQERGAHWPTWNAIRRRFGRYPDWWFATEAPSGPPWNRRPADWDNRAYGGLHREWGKDLATLPRLEKRAVGCRVLSIESQPTVFASRAYRKPSRYASNAAFAVEISQSESLTHTRSSTAGWSLDVSTTVGVEIGGEASQCKVKVETSVSFGVHESQTRERSASEAVQVSDSLSTQFAEDAPPSAALIASLQGSRGKIIVAVDYIYSLVGDGIVWYDQKALNGYKGHMLPLADLLRIMGKPNEQRVTETLDLGFVSDGTIVLADGVAQPNGRVVPV